MECLIVNLGTLEQVMFIRFSVFLAFYCITIIRFARSSIRRATFEFLLLG